jgi:hypothetical protein
MYKASDERWNQSQARMKALYTIILHKEERVYVG